MCFHSTLYAHQVSCTFKDTCHKQPLDTWVDMFGVYNSTYVISTSVDIFYDVQNF